MRSAKVVRKGIVIFIVLAIGHSRGYIEDNLELAN